MAFFAERRGCNLKQCYFLGGRRVVFAYQKRVIGMLFALKPLS